VMNQISSELNIEIEQTSGNVIFEMVGHENPVWLSLKTRLLSIEPTALYIPPDSLHVSWNTFASVAHYINGLHIPIELGPELTKVLQKPRPVVEIDISTETAMQKLSDAGFRNRELTAEQKRDLIALTKMHNGANFSVPGAGKTTVAIALHLLWRSNVTDGRLIVVAPKSAFIAWDETLELVSNERLNFLRLNAGGLDLAALEESTFIIVNYEMISAYQVELSRLMQNHNVHMILDESHRIKNSQSRRGMAALQLAAYPIRRDILSGTPAPQGPSDMAMQLSFLSPGSSVSHRLRIGSISTSEALKGRFVRTTKSELGLPPQNRVLIPVVPNARETLLYNILAQDLSRALLGLRGSDAYQVKRVGDCVMHLIRSTVDPEFVIASLPKLAQSKIELESPRVDDGSFPSKFLAARKIIERKISAGEKVVVWSTFPRTVEAFASYISDIGSVFIHGGVPIASESSTVEDRETRIRMFHNRRDCRVFVANPAACSEGISLHKAANTAIYLDRTFNAAHFLQSIDRIHRLGLDANVKTDVFVLNYEIEGSPSIDKSVHARLDEKTKTLGRLLDDTDLYKQPPYEIGDSSEGNTIDMGDIQFLKNLLAE